jgi:hypothetical protein
LILNINNPKKKHSTNPKTQVQVLKFTTKKQLPSRSLASPMITVMTILYIMFRQQRPKSILRASSAKNLIAIQEEMNSNAQRP